MRPGSSLRITQWKMQLGQERRNRELHMEKTWLETFQRYHPRHRETGGSPGFPFPSSTLLSNWGFTGWLHWKVSWHGSLGNAASMAARAELGRGPSTILQEVFKNYTWRVFRTSDDRLIVVCFGGCSSQLSWPNLNMTSPVLLLLLLLLSFTSTLVFTSVPTKVRL